MHASRNRLLCTPLATKRKRLAHFRLHRLAPHRRQRPRVSFTKMGRRIISLIAGVAASCAFVVSGASQSTAVPPEAIVRPCKKTDYGEGENTTKGNARSRYKTVPDGSIELRLCRYWGSGSGSQPQARPGRFEASRLIRRQGFVRSTARELNHLVPFPKAPHSCPADDGEHLYAAFRYPHEPEVVVEVRLSGCVSAVNGFGNGGLLKHRIRHRLEHLTEPGT
jgi:hypothetical protein